MNLNEFTLVIMTRDRPKMLIDCINSSEGKLGQLIVSDNSVADYSYKFPLYVTYVRRNGLLTGPEHFNTVVSEMRTKYFCIFHDDDLFIPDCFLEYMKFCNAQSNASAYCANALIADKYMTNIKISTTHNDTNMSVGAIRNMYLNPIKMGMPPFASYIYTSNAHVLLNVDHGQKFSDASMIFDIVSKSKVLFFNKPVMITRLHDTNDQNCYGVMDYKPMFNRLYSNKHSSLSVYNLYRISRFLGLKRDIQLKKSLRFKLISYYSCYLILRVLGVAHIKIKSYFVKGSR